MDVLMPAAYFPPISYFAYAMTNTVTIETKEHFVKQSLRNRCTIVGANGVLTLQIPRVKTKNRQIISESEIYYEDEDWRVQHWRSLKAAYRNSPYFEYYADDLEAFFNLHHTNHLNAALTSLKLMTKLLNISLDYQLTTSYETNMDGLDMRNAWDKKNYRENPPISEFPKYIQVFEDRNPFVQDLSILDLLFCQGPQSIDYLQSLKPIF